MSSKAGNGKEGVVGNNGNGLKRTITLMFILVSAAYFITVFQRYAVGVVTEELSRELDIGTIELGLMSSAYFIACAIAQPLVGLLTDTFSPLIIVAGCLGMGALGTWVFASSHSITMAFIGRIMIGAGLSGVFVPSVKAIGIAYGEERFASANGAFIAIGNAGTVLGTAIIVWLISLVGWRNSFSTVGASLVLLALLCWLVGRVRSGSEAVPIEDTSMKLEPAVVKPLRERLAAFFKDWNLWMVNIYMFARFGSQATFQGLWGIPYVMKIFGVSRDKAAISVMMIGLGYIASSPLVGYATDVFTRKTGDTFGTRRTILALTTGIYAFSWLPLTLMPGRFSIGMLNFFLFMMGVGASSGGLAFAIVNDLFNTRMVGQAMSIANIMSIFGAAAVPPMVGILIQRATDAGSGIMVAYGHSLWPCLVTSIISWLSMVLLRQRTR